MEKRSIWNKYEVTIDGTVTSKKRPNGLKHYESETGHKYVVLYDEEGKQHKTYIHILLYKTFVGEIPEGWVVHHKDFNQQNNDISNLELVERTEHIKLHKKNLSAESRKRISEAKMGAKNPAYGKPSKKRKKVLDMETGIIYEDPYEASEKTRYNSGTIKRHCIGKQKAKKQRFYYIQEVA